MSQPLLDLSQTELSDLQLEHVSGGKGPVYINGGGYGYGYGYGAYPYGVAVGVGWRRPYGYPVARVAARGAYRAVFRPYRFAW